MKDVILSKLSEIEKRENVKILYANESGSRAWGFESPDSDYDCRFIYIRRPEDYLRLDTVRDVIEWQLDDTLDINGWDIVKTLRLAHKSNPTVFEWRASPIVYKRDALWDGISSLIGEYFDKRMLATHYISMARRNIEAYLSGDTVRMKKYLYVLRPLLCCQYVLDKEAPPPMLMRTLTDEYIFGDTKEALDELLLRKLVTSELGECAHNTVLDEFISTEMTALNARIATLKKRLPEPWDRMNSAFISLLSDVWGR